MSLHLKCLPDNKSFTMEGASNAADWPPSRHLSTRLKGVRGLGWGQKGLEGRTGLAGRCSCRPSGVWLEVVVGMLTWTTSNSSKGGRYTVVFGRVADSGVPSSTSGRPWLYVSDSHSTGVSLRAHKAPTLHGHSSWKKVSSAHGTQLYRYTMFAAGTSSTRNQPSCCMGMQHHVYYELLRGSWWTKIPWPAMTECHSVRRASPHPAVLQH